VSLANLLRVVSSASYTPESILPSSSNCFSGNLFPLDTLFNSVDHISFLGAAWLFRRSLASVKGFDVGDTAVMAGEGADRRVIGLKRFRVSAEASRGRTSFRRRRYQGISVKRGSWSCEGLREGGSECGLSPIDFHSRDLRFSGDLLRLLLLSKV